MSDEVETLKPEDFVGWTVEVKNNQEGIDDGIYYCVSIKRSGSLQLRGHGEPTNPNLEEKIGVNWWTLPDDGVTRFEKGDHAP